MERLHDDAKALRPNPAIVIYDQPSGRRKQPGRRGVRVVWVAEPRPRACEYLSCDVLRGGPISGAKLHEREHSVELCCVQGGEGLVARRRGSTDEPGPLPDGWHHV